MLSLFLLRKILFWFSAGAKPRREYKGSLPIYPNIPPKIPHPTHKLCYRPVIKFLDFHELGRPGFNGHHRGGLRGDGGGYGWD
jgi:hypothetical protein